MFSLFYGIYRRAAAKIVFDATRRIIQTRPPRQGGEVFNTVPSPERYTNSYIKPNTGDGREPSPPLCYIKPNTGDGKEPSPPQLIEGRPYYYTSYCGVATGDL